MCMPAGPSERATRMTGVAWSRRGNTVLAVRMQAWLIKQVYTYSELKSWSTGPACACRSPYAVRG